MKLYKKIILIIPLFIVAVVLGGLALSVKAFEPPTEKWVINESPSPGSLPYTAINFISNETSFSIIRSYGQQGDYSIRFNTDVVVWSDGTWVNQAFRTIAFETAPTGDLLTWLQANAVKIIPTVTFETNGGNVIDPITSDTLPELEVPTKSGYNFIGWYYDIDLSQIAQQGDTLTEDITLYASFEKPHLLDIINNHITPILLITFGVFATIGNAIINNNILLILFSFVMVLISFGVIRKVFGLIKSFNDKDNDNHNNTHTTII